MKRCKLTRECSSHPIPQKHTQRAKEIADKVEGAMQGLLAHASDVEAAIRSRATHKAALFRLLRAARHLSSHKVFLELESGGNVRFEDLDLAQLPAGVAALVEQLRLQTQGRHAERTIEVQRLAKITSKQVTHPRLTAVAEGEAGPSVGKRPVPRGFDLLGEEQQSQQQQQARGFCVLVDGAGCAQLFRHLDPNVNPNGSVSQGTVGAEGAIPCYNHFPFPEAEGSVMAQGLVCSYPLAGLAGPLAFNAAGVAELAGTAALRAAHLTPEYVCEVYGAREGGPGLPLSPHLERPILEFAYSKFVVHGDLPEISVREMFGKPGEPVVRPKTAASPPDALAAFTPRKWAEVEATYPILSFMEKTLILAPESYDDLPPTHGSMHIYAANIGQLQQLGRFTALRTLSLAALQLETVPAALAECPLLEELDLSLNQIQSIHGCLQGNAHLHTLDLYANDISCVGDLDEGLQALRDLELRSNPITKRNSYHPSLRALYPGLERLDGIVFVESVASDEVGLALVRARPSPPPSPPRYPTDHEAHTHTSGHAQATMTSLLLRNSLPSEQLYPSFASRTPYCQSVAEQRAHYLLHRTIPPGTDSLEGIVILELDGCRLLSLSGMPDR
jgi:hypothetical protein